MIQIAIIFRIIYIFETYPALYRKLKVCKLINLFLYNCHNLFKYCNYYDQKGTNIEKTTCTNKYFFSKYNFLYKILIKIYWIIQTHNRKFESYFKPDNTKLTKTQTN